MEDFHSFAGFPEIRQMEEKFLPQADIVRRYEDTMGYKPGGESGVK
jgi:hypothetical protein